MVAGLLLAARPAVDAGLDQAIGEIRRQQQVVQPQALVARPAVPQIGPEGPKRSGRMELAQGVGPALAQQALISGADLWLQQRVVGPRVRLIDVGLGGHDIVVAGQHHRRAAGSQVFSVGDQALEPSQLVVELGAGPWIAVGQVEAGDQHAIDRRLDIAGLRIGRIARQGRAGDDRLGLSRQDRHAVPAALAFPDGVVAQLGQRLGGEGALLGLELLQADDVRLGLGQPVN